MSNADNWAAEIVDDEYRDWPIEVIDGVRWHVSPSDPEGVEGQTRVPCADQTDVQGGTR